MSPLYVYSLLPVVSVALLLFFTAALHGRGARGLAAYCLSVAVWSGTLLLVALEPTAALGQRLVASGAFVVATYLHAAWDITGEKRYGLVWFAYAVAAAITALGLLVPGLLYDPLSLSAGPFFWQSMVLAVTAASVPVLHLGRAWRQAPRGGRSHIAALLGAGLVGYLGAWTNAFMLSHGTVRPWGLIAVLASLLLLAHVVAGRQAPGQRRLLERSLGYSALAALVSAGFLFGVMHLMSGAGEPLLREYRIGAFVILVLAAVAFEPVRQQVQEWLGRRLVPGRAGATDLARALAEQEVRADQAARLAELGTISSAVAHEVRNPLGVLSAHLKLLERAGTDPEVVAAMREQIDRAGGFVDDFLRYGRPAPLELRMVDLDALVTTAWATARSALGDAVPAVDLAVDGGSEGLLVEADQSQLLQVLVVLFENALLAQVDGPSPFVRVTAARDGDEIVLAVEDAGPGIPPELEDRLFEPFVTGRGRQGPKPGTGLGLAIARGIVGRHGGALTAGRSDALGGARFEIRMPRIQKVLAAAAEVA